MNGKYVVMDGQKVNIWAIKQGTLGLFEEDQIITTIIDYWNTMNVGAPWYLDVIALFKKSIEGFFWMIILNDQIGYFGLDP
jgi:hypothetical protein